MTKQQYYDYIIDNCEGGFFFGSEPEDTGGLTQEEVNQIKQIYFWSMQRSSKSRFIERLNGLPFWDTIVKDEPYEHGEIDCCEQDSRQID